MGHEAFEGAGMHTRVVEKDVGRCVAQARDEGIQLTRSVGRKFGWGTAAGDPVLAERKSQGCDAAGA